MRVISVFETKTSMNPPMHVPSNMKGSAFRKMETKVMLNVPNSGVCRKKRIRLASAAKNANWASTISQAAGVACSAR